MAKVFFHINFSGIAEIKLLFIIFISIEILWKKYFSYYIFGDRDLLNLLLFLLKFCGKVFFHINFSGIAEMLNK